MAKDLDVLSKNPQEREIARKACEENYKSLMKNVSGAFFSFGDEAQIKEAIKMIAKTPYGQNVLANLPKNIQVESERFDSDEMTSVFFSSDGKLKLNSADIEGKMPIPILFHELLHAKQYNLGEMQTKGMSAGQVMVRSLVAEAEAEGWERMHKVMNQAFQSYTPTKEQVSKFMRMDLYAIAKRRYPKLDEDYFRKSNPLYAFQRQLRASEGRLYQAQKAFVGDEILNCVSAFSDPDSHDKNETWKSYYTAQAMDYTAHAMKKGHLTQQGNIQAFHHHLDRVASDYSVPRASLTRLNLSQEEMQVYAEVIEVGKQAGFTLAQQNQARNWQGTQVLPDELCETSLQGVASLRAMNSK